jgi:two-component system nitrate/nitrite response regulator NarL
MTVPEDGLANSLLHTMSIAEMRRITDVPQSARVKILVGSSQALFRESLRAALEKEHELCVVGISDSCGALIDDVARVRPRVVLVDARLDPGVIGAIRDVRARTHPPAVLCLGRRADYRFLDHAIRAGANGFVTRSAFVADLAAAVHAVDRGEMVVPPEMLAGAIQRLLGTDDIHEDALKRIARLSQRERRVLALVSRGATNAAVAQTLFISPLTAKTHIQNVLRKLGVHSRLEAAMLVAQNDLIYELERGGL